MSIRNLSANLFAASPNNERESLVAAGRLLMRDYTAKQYNLANPKTPIDLKINDANTYDAMNEGFRKDFFNYAGKIAYAQYDKTWDSEKDIDSLRSLGKSHDMTFLKVLADITSEIVSPMIPEVISDLMGAFANTSRIGYDETKEFNIHSNAVINFEDVAWGTRSQRAQYLYDKTVTARPTPVSALVKINWYSFVAENKDMGQYFFSIARGAGAYIMGRFYKTFMDGISNTALLPSAYKFAAYDADNFIKAAQLVAAANGVTRREVACFGTLTALDKVIPDVASNTSGAYAMATAAGEEWLQSGFLTNYKGTGLYEIQNVLKPNTVNTTPEFLISDTTLWFASLNGYKPCEVVFQGDDINLVMRPSETEDFTINVDMTMTLDVVTLMGSKIAVISNVQ